MNKNFYEQCAELLGTTHDGEPFPYYKRTRWNNRKAGQGRYPSYGLIRKFGDVIHVCLHHPVSHNKVYNTEDEVLDFLRSLHIPS